MQVSELLHTKGSDVVVIEQSATISAALASLKTHNIGALVVSDDGKAIQGILSERDVVRSLAEQGAPALEASVGSIMSSVVQTCSPDDSVESLVTVMTNHRVRHIPVTDEEVLVGIISIGDVVKTRMQELEKDRDALVEFIHAR